MNLRPHGPEPCARTRRKASETASHRQFTEKRSFCKPLQTGAGRRKESHYHGPENVTKALPEQGSGCSISASVRRSPAINGAKGRRAVVEHCKHRARAEGASYQEAECNLSADDK